MFEITVSYSMLGVPEVIATCEDLTEAAFADAIEKLPAHAGSVICWEADAEHEGYADAFTSRGLVYSMRPAVPPLYDVERPTGNALTRLETPAEEMTTDNDNTDTE